MKYMKEFRGHFSSRPAFTAREADLFLRNRGSSSGYHKLVIHNMLSRKEIYRITKGNYTFHEDVQMVGFGFEPFYYGLEDALSLRNMWEQETNPVVITPHKVRIGLRQFQGRNFIVRRIDRRMFFGYSYIQYGDYYIPVSEAEKTFIDLIYFNVGLSGELITTILSKIDKKVLYGLLKEVPTWLTDRVKKIVNEFK